MTTRRELLVALGASALAPPLRLYAQQRDKVWRVGYLTRSPGEFHDAFVRGLKELGWAVGSNLLVEYRTPDRAAELVSMKVDIIFADGTPSTQAALKATRDIPIIFANVS